MVVKDELDKIGLRYAAINLGEVETIENITVQQREELKIALLKKGLELMDDKKAILIEKIKNVIIVMIHYADELPKEKFSDYLSEKLNHNYTYLSGLFLTVQGITIEKFIITHKIECAKELLVYNKLNLTEIAYKLHYSNVAHLSSQFKKITGITPSYFKRLEKEKRSLLEARVM